MLVQAVTHGGFRGFTNRFEGWEQTVETEGCREPVIGIDARARESCMCGYGSCLRAAANGRVRKLVHGERWGYLEEGLVGDSHTRVWNYATDVGTCGAMVRYVRERGGGTVYSARGGRGHASAGSAAKETGKGVGYSYFLAGFGGSDFLL